jgi:hypothetical protein
VASSSLEVIIAGKDTLSPALKKIEGGLGKVNTAAKSLGKTFATGLAMGAGIAGFNVFVGAVERAVGAIPAFIEQGIAFGETIDFIVDATGASAEAASKFAGQVQYTTGTLDGVVAGLRAASQQITSNYAEWEALGVTVRNADGSFRDTISVVEDARGVIQSLGAGAAASTKLIELFGRSGLNMADYMSMSAPQVALLNDELARMGYIVKDVSVFESAKRELNLWDMAWQGLSATLTAAVLPAVRQVLAGITEAVVTYGPQIKSVLADIINFVAGVVSGLTNMTVTPFAAQMSALAGATGGSVMSFDQWLASTGQVKPTTTAAAGGVSNLTAALDKQTAALDRQIAKIRESDDAAERAFQRTMGRLADAVGDQLSALDAAEKARDVDRQRAQYAQDLADARRDLAKVLSSEVVDQDALRTARDRIRDIVDATNEWERSLSVDKVRSGLEQVKTYIEDIARLEADATNKPALLKNLATREKVIESARAAAVQRGDIEAVAAYDAKLDAIRTAKSRTEAAIRAGDKISVLDREKAKIEEVRDAAVAANSTVAASTGKTLAQLKAEYETYAKDAEASIARVRAAMEDVNSAAFGTQTGKEKRATEGAISPIAKAFQQGKAAADKLKVTMDDLVTGAQNFAKFLLDAYTTLSDIFTKLSPPDWFVQIATFPNPFSLAVDMLNNGIPAPPDWWPGQGGSGGLKYPLVPKAAGGPVRAGHAYTVGETGRETLVMGDQSGYIIPNGGGMMLVETTVMLDGEVVGRAMDRYLTRRSGK